MLRYVILLEHDGYHVYLTLIDCIQDKILFCVSYYLDTTLLHSTYKINGQNYWSTIYWYNVLTFPTGDVSVYDDLGSVEEVPKLGLPDNQVVGVVDAHTVLKPKHSLLRQGTVSQL